MQVTVYTSFEDLPQSLVERWRYPTESNFFLSLDWFACLFNSALKNELAPRLYCVNGADGQLKGVLCCGVKKNGRQLVSLTNFYSLEFSVVLFSESAEHRSVIEALVGHIASERPRWSVVELRYLRAHEPVLGWFLGALKEKGFAVSQFRHHENWYLGVGDRTFAQYIAQRSSVIRKTLPRSERKLKEGFKVEIRLLRDAGSELEAALGDYTTVYGRSWKRPEPYADFMPTLIRTCADLGILRLALLYLDGEPVAAQLWMMTGHRAVIYKVAYDERFKKLSAGSVLSNELFRIAIDVDRVAEIDYGVGSDAYKKDWMEAVRSIEGVEGFNLMTLRGLVLAAKLSLKRVIGRHDPGNQSGAA